MSKQPLFSVIDRSAVDAINRYAMHRAFQGKALIDTFRKIMKFWVHFAIGKIPRGNREKIISNLMQVVVGYTRLSVANKGIKSSLRSRKVVRKVSTNRFRGTLADRLARQRSARTGKPLSPSRFVSGKAWSAGLHRAGLAPAIAGAGVPYRARLPKLKNPAGSYEEKIMTNTVSITALNFASSNGSRAAGIEGLAPSAFSAAQNEVYAQVNKWLTIDIRNAAKDVGFRLLQP
jgi:hypothetical protein